MRCVDNISSVSTMSILFYKRPDYIAREGGPLTRSNCQKYVEKASCSRAAIPDELSFENVMEGKTMPVLQSFTLCKLIGTDL